MAVIWTDNRDLREIENYQTARIEALKKRIKELETENDSVRWLLEHNTAFRNHIQSRITDLRKEFLRNG